MKSNHRSWKKRTLCYATATGIIAAAIIFIASPQFMFMGHPSCKSTCTYTVNDVLATAGALAEYFSIPGNTTVTAHFVAGKDNTRPYILIGKTNGSFLDASNTLMLSSSTTSASVRVIGRDYIISVTEGAGECEDSVVESDSQFSRGADGSVNYTITL